MTTLTDVTPAQIIHSDAAAHEFDAIQLLRLCHTYLRGAEIRLPGGCRPLDRDKLARQINLYLNDLHTHTTEPQGQAHDQDQRDHAGAPDQAAA